MIWEISAHGWATGLLAPRFCSVFRTEAGFEGEKALVEADHPIFVEDDIFNLSDLGAWGGYVAFGPTVLHGFSHRSRI